MPPPLRREDDFSVAELARIMATLSIAVDGLREDIKKLSLVYDTKERVDLLVGGIKVDVRRLEEEQSQIREDVAAQERETNRRFRQAVTLTLTSLLAPLVIALVVFILTQVAKP